MQNRYEELLQRASVKTGDQEHKALFYILAGNEELYNKINNIYDFNQGMIKHDLLEINEDSPDYITEPSSSGTKLLKLAFNLYNSQNKADVCDTFAGLDSNNFELAIQAIKIRFGQ